MFLQIGDMMRNHAHFSSSPLTNSLHRYDAVDFTSYVVYEKYDFFLPLDRAEIPPGLIWDAFFKVYQVQAWATIIGFLAILWMISGRSKVLFFLFTTFASVVLLIFGTDLTAQMTTGRREHPIRRLEDIQANNLELHAVNGAFTSSFIQSRGIPFKETKNVSHLIHTVINGGERAVGFDTDYSISDFPELGVIPDFRDSFLMPCAFAFQTQSELLPLFDHWLNKLRQSGHLHHLEAKWVRRKETGRTIDEAKAMGWSYLCFPFAALTCGSLLAIIIAFIEWKKEGLKGSPYSLEPKRQRCRRDSRWNPDR